MRPVFKVYALCVVAACYITMLITFAYAYLNGMQTLVTINSVGEANLELVLLGSSLLILFIWAGEDIKKEVSV